MPRNISWKGPSETHACSSEQGNHLLSETPISCDVYSCSSVETRSRPASCWCFRESSRRKNDSSETLGTWLGRKVSGRLGKPGWCPQPLECLSDHSALWSMCSSASHVWANGMKRALKMLVMAFLISQAPFTHVVEAPSFPKSCPELTPVMLPE